MAKLKDSRIFITFSPDKTLHSVFCFGAISFFIFRHGGGESEVEFLLRGKLTEFKCGLGFAKTIFWGKGFGKTDTDFPPAGGMRAGFVLRNWWG